MCKIFLVSLMFRFCYYSRTLEKKLHNFAFLKLNRVMLSKKVNSEKRILSNIYIITLQLAKRISIYMSYLNHTENYFNCLNDFKHKKIFKIIEKIHFQIIKKIKNLTEWSECNHIKKLSFFFNRSWCIINNLNNLFTF